jgi:tryptophanyl-tRNA synthetase
MTDTKKHRVLSGLQPSGKLHLGNYFGAVQQYLELQEKGHDVFYFVANYHALTSITDPEAMREHTMDVVLDLLALGLDPERATIFLQSDVPEVCELAWFLSTVTPMSLLEKCHSYKDKLNKGIAPNHALFAYPTLMAADILAYDSTLVPVGRDQKQHLEVTRDIAVKYNLLYKQEVFTLPDEYIVESTAVVPGIDGQKMSKSYNNTIGLFLPEKKLKKRINQIVTDSSGVEDSKNPEDCNVYALLKLFCSEEELAEWADRYRAGGMGFGEAKKGLFEKTVELLGPARVRREELEKNQDFAAEVLRKGAERARAIAAETVARTRKAAGIS